MAIVNAFQRKNPIFFNLGFSYSLTNDIGVKSGVFSHAGIALAPRGTRCNTLMRYDNCALLILLFLFVSHWDS